jgi:hypothetical protein
MQHSIQVVALFERNGWCFVHHPNSLERFTSGNASRGRSGNSGLLHCAVAVLVAVLVSMLQSRMLQCCNVAGCNAAIL